MIEDCPICLENVSEADSNTSSCGHRFHDQCLTTWLMTSNTCPMCRTNLDETETEYNNRLMVHYQELEAINNEILRRNNIRSYFEAVAKRNNEFLAAQSVN